MATEDKQVRKLREKLEAALAKRKDDDALKLLEQLIEAEPKAPRWPHKRGELYVKRNRKTEAIADYTLAASLYADQGFLARAVAMAKTIIDLDPKRIDVLERLDPEAARKLHRQQRPDGSSLRPGAMHAAIVESDPPMAAHPALLPETGAPAPVRAPSRVRDAVKRVTSEDPKAAKAKAAASAPRRDEVRKPAPAADLSSPGLDVADELTIDPDAKPNETRFSNAPPARVIRPNISDVELEPRKVAPVPGSARPVPPDARTLSKLPLFPLFAELPQAALVEMVKRADVIELPDGTVVVRKGEPADALYGIVEGSVEVVVPGQTTKMTLAEGDVFGEACLLAGEKR
ncbi:MAG: cyclic nucleotide-binding domain-containing protein, partial [Polyangiales bacterium]